MNGNGFWPKQWDWKMNEISNGMQKYSSSCGLQDWVQIAQFLNEYKGEAKKIQITFQT